MREILFLLLLSMPLMQCNSPMENKLITENLHAKMMTFLVRHVCVASTIVNEPEFSKLQENNLLPGATRNLETCSDTIGFLPISKEKVQVFVTVNDNYKKKDGTTERKIIQTDLKFNNVIVVTYKIGNNNDWESELPSSASTVFTVSNFVDKFLLTNTEAKGIIQFQSFYLEKKTGTLSDEIKTGVWSLTVTLETETGGSNTPKVYTGDPLGVNIFDKLRCDPEKVSFPIGDVAGIRYEKLSKIKEKIETEILYYYEGDKPEAHPFFKTAVTECPYTMTFTTSTSKKLYHKSTMTCKSRTTGTTPPKTEWYYVAEGFKSEDTTQQSKQYIEFAVDEDIKVECSERKCTTCVQPANGKVCFAESGCAPVHQKPGYGETCHVLDKCLKNLARFNDGKFEKSDKLEIPCNDEGKYMIPASYSNAGIEIHNISCAEQFSRTESELDHTTKNESVALATVDPQQPADCGSKCACKLGRKLAIANSDLTSWLRIETLVFDNNTGEWTYTRKHKDGGMMTHQLAQDKQGGERPFACVLDTPDSRTEAQKDLLRKNPTKNIVIVVNLVLLAVLAGATIPGVIYYVNSQIKKREAKKAAKKDKKKEEQSGDKKDGDTKKDEEKKNEA